MWGRYELAKRTTMGPIYLDVKKDPILVIHG